MTKSQLVEAIAAKAPHVPRPQVEGIVNAVFDAMGGALKSGQRIEIRGFGSLSVKVRPARKGRNPKTGKQVSVPERRTLSFVCGKELRERLNGGAAQSDVTPRPALVRALEAGTAPVVPVVPAAPELARRTHAG